jgi:PAS domain S-box-containing protein/TyrR family helix-turn-helix protein
MVYNVFDRFFVFCHRRHTGFPAERIGGGFMKSHRDLLDKIKELEAVIKKQGEDLELLEAAFNLSEVGFTLSDANGVVIKINPSQIRITGHDPENTLGRSMADIEVENFNQSATMQVVHTKKPVTIEQTLPSGKSYLVYGQPYFDREGALRYVVCNLVDNTRHNYTRQELEAARNSNIQLEKTVHRLQEIVNTQNTPIYCSKKMQALIGICDKVAPFNSTILILGQSGAGKEVIADYIHRKSSRAGKPFIKINCAAIPETLLESELFGYDAGAFTGARSGGKKGILEITDGGTVLLDEVSNVSLKALVARYEKGLISKYWEKYKSASKIAEVLDTTQPTVSRKLRAYGILK